MKRISLLLFFIGCFLFSLSATNYFVATNGSDSNSGTIDKPFATLDKAQSKVMAGDTVYIRQGTYRVTEAEIMEHYTAGSTTWSRVFTSPTSMESSLSVLGGMECSGRKCAVLGDMLELGDYSKKAHYEVGQAVADNKIDFLLAFGNDAKYIVDGAKENGMKNAFYFNNKEELSNKLFELANKGDAVIFKASRGMKLEDVINNVYDRWEK